MGQRMHKVTIEDISRHTGLSRGTVSRALNNRPDISEQTRQRVLEACTRLRYVPSHAARSLATGRRYAIAVLVEDLRSTFAACFLRGAIGCAGAQRYGVFVSEVGGDGGAILDYLHSLVDERVDAVLIATPLRGEVLGRIIEPMRERPVVASAPISGLSCDILSPDHVEAGRLVAREMLREPTRRVLYVHEAGSVIASKSLEGFQAACRQAGLDPAAITVEVPPYEAGGPRRLEAVRGRLGDVRVVAAANDFLAVELMLLCAELGRAPGREVAFIGQGNELIGTRVWPPLTTIDYCGEEIGQRAMDLAVQRVTKTREDAAQRILVTPVLVARESTRMIG